MSRFQAEHCNQQAGEHLIRERGNRKQILIEPCCAVGGWEEQNWHVINLISAVNFTLISGRNCVIADID